MSETPQGRTFDTAVVADRLAVVAKALFAVYLASVLAFSLPPKLLDTLWQLNAIKVLIEAAPIPLLGMALLHLAAYLCPSDLKLERQRRALARLAIAASLGFLLIVPLQGYAVWTSYRRSNSVADQQQAGAGQRAESVRQAIQQASSPEDLRKRLLALQRPDLRINLNSEQFSSIPLPILKRELFAQLDQAEGQYKSRFARLDPGVIERLTRESLRFMLSSAAFAVAFAAVAQRKNSPVPFLVEWRYLPGLVLAALQPRRSRSTQRGTGPFQDSASKREAEFFASLAPPEDEAPPSP